MGMKRRVPAGTATHTTIPTFLCLLPPFMLYCQHTVGPTELDACGADSTTKSPTNVEDGHRRLPSVWFAMFGPGIPRL